MDLSKTIIAKSDQLNADDLMGGPQTFTVTDVRMGDAEQPVSIVLAEWPDNRPFKPSKTVLRILVLAWGVETNDWPKNARMTLYRDAGVKWAGQEIGGIRVSHLSHLDKPLKVALQETKGKKVLYTVDPLPDLPAEAADTITSGQLKNIGRAMTVLGMKDRDAALGFVSGVVGREITSRNDLTRDEASRVIDRLKALESAQEDVEAKAEEAPEPTFDGFDQ